MFWFGNICITVNLIYSKILYLQSHIFDQYSSYSRRVCGFVPDFRHHEAMLDHQRVTYGRHHGENVLAGWISPHQVQQGVSLMLRVQFVDALLCDQLHGNSAVVLIEKETHMGLEDWKTRSTSTHHALYLTRKKDRAERTWGDVEHLDYSLKSEGHHLIR